MDGLQPTFDWVLAPPPAVSPALAAAARAAGLSDRTTRLLTGRGVHDPADLAAHLGDPRAALHDPRLLPDAALLEARIARARADHERVLVFGDFDADGLTGLAILVTALERLGLDVGWHVPDREGEGHGLSASAIDHAAAEARTLIITVDTGSSSVAEVALAVTKGIDVVITDHHHLPPVLPAAVALVNPHRHDSLYPDDRLAGSGVAFKVAQLLLAGAPGGPAAALELADLAIIGTIADVAPIVGENRAIARLGLARLRGTPRPGIAALLQAAGVAPQRVDLERIGFALAPRLNSGGRMGDVATAARLLLTTDATTASELAARLETSNRERRDLTVTVLEEARAAAAGLAAGPVIVAGAWPVGIIGLVAGRLAEDRAAPAIVIATGAGSWRASGRGPAGSQLAAAFEACADLLERHGGHPQAAGCQFDASVYPALQARLMPLLAVSVVARERRPGGGPCGSTWTWRPPRSTTACCTTSIRSARSRRVTPRCWWASGASSWAASARPPAATPRSSCARAARCLTRSPLAAMTWPSRWPRAMWWTSSPGSTAGISAAMSRSSSRCATSRRPVISLG